MKTIGLIKKIRQLRIRREAVSLERIRRVLIVWDASQSKTDIDEIKSFGHEMRTRGKDLIFLAFHDLKKLRPDMQPNDMYRLCCKGDFDFFNNPKGKDLKELLNEEFDLMINACLKENFHLKIISAFSKARFRIGPFIHPKDVMFYELLISPNGANPCENYLIETGRYLGKII